LIEERVLEIEFTFNHKWFNSPTLWVGKDKKFPLRRGKRTSLRPRIRWTGGVSWGMTLYVSKVYPNFGFETSLIIPHCPLLPKGSLREEGDAL